MTRGESIESVKKNCIKGGQEKMKKYKSCMTSVSRVPPAHDAYVYFANNLSISKGEANADFSNDLKFEKKKMEKIKNEKSK